MVGSLQKVLEKAKRDRQQAATAKKKAERQLPSAESLAKGPAYSQVREVALDMNTVLANRCVCANSEVLEGDFYKVLRTQIQHAAAENDLRTIMVTSTMPDEGKTLTCINLAFSFARAFDQTVMLIDADLKKQQVHKSLGIASQYGLVDYLIRKQPIGDCLIRPKNEKLVLISGGMPVTDSSELLGSALMQQFVRQTRNRYKDRLVFFDTPPVMVGADVMAFAPLVDGIVFVIRAGQTSVKQAQQAMDLLPKDKLIGVVLNGQKMSSKESQLYYGKKYAYI